MCSLFYCKDTVHEILKINFKVVLNTRYELESAALTLGSLQHCDGVPAPHKLIRLHTAPALIPQQGQICQLNTPNRFIYIQKQFVSFIFRLRNGITNRAAPFLYSTKLRKGKLS
jgi:hypothetical protein